MTSGMPRDAANHLYDSACELLLAVRTLRSAATPPECAPALPATLGCLGEAFRELAATADHLAAGLCEPLFEAQRVCETARARKAA